MRKTRKEKGITLVALIITIIVMMILVAVSVAIIIKSDLLGTAKGAGTAYRSNMDAEQNFGTGNIKINNEDTTMGDYIGTINGGVQANEQVVVIHSYGSFILKEQITCIPGETWREWIERHQGQEFMAEDSGVSFPIVWKIYVQSGYPGEPEKETVGAYTLDGELVNYFSPAGGIIAADIADTVINYGGYPGSVNSWDYSFAL